MPHIPLPDDGSFLIGANEYFRTDLTELCISDGVKSITIGECAFKDRTKLSSLSIPHTVESIIIGAKAFYRTGLTELCIPDGVKSITIGKYAFGDCIKLSSLSIPPTVESIIIEANAFYHTGLTELCIPDGVKSITIGRCAFRSCNNLSSLSLPTSFDSIIIVDYAFQDCKKLMPPEFPDGAQIKDEAFFGCKVDSSSSGVFKDYLQIAVGSGGFIELLHELGVILGIL